MYYDDILKPSTRKAPQVHLNVHTISQTSKTSVNKDEKGKTKRGFHQSSILSKVIIFYPDKYSFRGRCCSLGEHTCAHAYTRPEARAKLKHRANKLCLVLKSSDGLYWCAGLIQMNSHHPLQYPMPGDKSNAESHKVLLQPGRVSLLCWLCVLSAGWVFFCFFFEKCFDQQSSTKTTRWCSGTVGFYLGHVENVCHLSLSDRFPCVSRWHTAGDWRRDVQGLQINQSKSIFFSRKKLCNLVFKWPFFSP